MFAWTDETLRASTSSKEVILRFAIDAIGKNRKKSNDNYWRRVVGRVQRADRPKFTIASQEQKLNDRRGSNKDISNYQVDHQVLAALLKTVLF